MRNFGFELAWRRKTQRGLKANGRQQFAELERMVYCHASRGSFTSNLFQSIFEEGSSMSEISRARPAMVGRG
jgi:hypothetical protein